MAASPQTLAPDSVDTAKPECVRSSERTRSPEMSFTPSASSAKRSVSVTEFALLDSG